MPSRTALVIGSGPSGFTTSIFLLRRGWTVTMLDFGTTASDTDRFNVPHGATNENREDLVNIEKFNWRNRRQEGESLDPARMSDRYFFARTRDYVIHETVNAVANISLSFGGLSNLWGGNVLPPDPGDITDWPVSIDELKSYYNPVAELMPISADPDDSLSTRFDFPWGNTSAFPLGHQGAQMLDDLGRRRVELEKQGVYFGLAKLAIDPSAPVDPDHHPYPFGPIFNSASSTRKLQEHSGFRYVPDIYVERVTENGHGSVTAEGVETTDGSPCSFVANKAFISCGILSSGQLLARSFGLNDIPLTVRTSQNAFFPFIRFQRSKDITRQPSNSISQLFIDIKNDSTRNRFAHIEAHQMGDYVIKPLIRLLGRFSPTIFTLGRPFLERILVMQAFLHSDFSDTLEVRYREKDNWKASINGVRNPLMRHSYNALLRFLSRNVMLCRGLPIRPILLVDPPGGSNHLGGTFPMQDRPRRRLCSDSLGRPLGSKDIHVTDSSILPSLPATTLTFSVMANAARIADSVGRSTS